MINLSFDELSLIAQIRNISNYENKSKEDLIKALTNQNQKQNPDQKQNQNQHQKQNQKIRRKLKVKRNRTNKKKFNKLRHKFS